MRRDIEKLRKEMQKLPDKQDLRSSAQSAHGNHYHSQKTL